ncbi:hypothetical protein [Streptomyces sp. NPDC059209]|uniref:hypothetical protein n=1 Tax=Streptomyces sp. NPDC059209 TaxID=3346769 RepID=UPI00368E71E6
MSADGAAADRVAVPAAVRPAGAAGAVTVREYGTRYLRMAVRYHGDARFSRQRVPGPAHDRPQTPPPPAVHTAPQRVDTALAAAVSGAGRGDRLAIGEWDTASGGAGVLYRVPGAVSVARLLPSGDDTGFRLSAGALADAGRTPRQLHGVSWEFTGPAPPHQGVRRLPARLSASGDSSTEGASTNVPDDARPRALVRDRLGSRLRTRPTGPGPAHLPPGRGGAVLLHGAPSTGWLVPSPAGDHTVQLTGADPALGLGRVLGEPHEPHEPRSPPRAVPAPPDRVRPWTVRRQLTPCSPTASVRRTAGRTHLLGTAHRAPARPSRRGPRAATLRLAVHTQDCASFVGWHEDLRHCADLSAETLDADGAPTLQW